jgi:thiol-disulfide isomerase/thioredoxin
MSNSFKSGYNYLIVTIGFIIVAVAGFFMYLTVSSRNETKQVREGQAITSEATQTDSTATVYKEFTQEEFEKARNEGKNIILIYYADWCPICRGEAPLIEAGFKGLHKPNTIGFKVNYNDGMTDDDEKALAKEQGVTYQHTKVVLREGKIVLKDGNPWDTEEFKKQINSVL